MPAEQVMQIEEPVNWFIDRIGHILNDDIIINNYPTYDLENRQTIISYFMNDDNYGMVNLNYIYNDLEPSIPFVDHSAEVVVVADMEISEEEKDCCVCMEDRVKTDICRISCDHTFCSGCVKNVMCRQKKCPLCRAKISKICVQTEENRVKFNNFE